MQLSVYFGQPTILSSWPQEVPIGWHANEACLFFLHFAFFYSIVTNTLCAFPVSIDRFYHLFSTQRPSYLYHVIIGSSNFLLQLPHT